MLQHQYLLKAKDAFVIKDYRKCLVLLSNFSQWDESSVSLLVNSAYLLWTKIKPKILDEQLSNTGQVEEISILNTVHTSFQRLLNGSVPNPSIAAFDYIRLSHVYILEGNFTGALDIMRLASVRGHLESILIVVQSWLLLKRLKQQKEASNYIRYLMSGVTLLSNQVKASTKSSEIFVESSNLPLGCLYLLCCQHILKQYNQFSSVKSKESITFELSFLIEAYSIIVGKITTDIEELTKWLSHSSLWFDFGIRLVDSPFVLVAEELLWQSFLRNPLKDEQSLCSIVKIMKKTGRSADIPFLLAKAYKICNWNIYCRSEIIAIEATFDEPELSKWLTLFQLQFKSSCTIQKLLRGHSLRCNWRPMKLRLLAIRDEHHRKMHLSDTKAIEYGVKLRRKLLLRWKGFIRDLKIQKKNASILIQNNFRRFFSTKKYKAMLYRMSIANSKFLQVVYGRFEMTRLHYFKVWFDKYYEIKRRSSANVIADVLLINGYNQLLVKGMDMFLGIVRVHRAHLCKRVLHSWLSKFQHKKLRTAKYTIRWFIRAVYSKIDDRKHEEMLHSMEVKIAQKQEVSFQHKNTPLLREMWRNWRVVLTKCRTERLVLKMILSIQRKFSCLKAKKRLNEMKCRAEVQAAFVLFRRTSRLSFILTQWRCLGAVLKIQRFFRCTISKNRLSRLQCIYKEVRKRLKKRGMHLKLKLLTRWKIFIYITAGETRRRKESLLLYFTWLKFCYKLARRILSIARNINFSMALNVVSRKSLLNNFFRRDNLLHISHKLFVMISLIKRATLYEAWKHWKLQDLSQQYIRNKAKIAVENMGYVLSTSLSRLVDYSQFLKINLFYRWMYLHRLRIRNSANFISIKAIDMYSHAMLCFCERRSAAFVLQRFYKTFVCIRRGYLNTIFLARFLREKEIVIASFRLRKIFLILFQAANQRWQSRKILQRFFKSRFRRKANLLHICDKGSHLKQCISEISSLMQSKILKSLFAKWFQQFLRVIVKSAALKQFKVKQTKVESYEIGPFQETGHQRIVAIPGKFTRPIKIKNGVSSKEENFQSQNFHAALHQLKASGTFIYDQSLGLKFEEVVLLSSKAIVVFLNTIDRSILECLAKYFQGSKIIFHGGVFTKILVTIFLDGWLNSMLPHITREVSVQLLDVKFTLSSVQCFASKLLPMNTDISYRLFTEIQLSPTSTGLTGFLFLVSFLKHLTFVEKVVLYVDGEKIPEFHLALTELSFAPALKDLKIFGLLDKESVLALSLGIENAFNQLNRLEFSTLRSAETELKSLISLAKLKEEKTGEGLSVISWLK